MIGMWVPRFTLEREAVSYFPSFVTVVNCFHLYYRNLVTRFLQYKTFTLVLDGEKDKLLQ